MKIYGKYLTIAFFYGILSFLHGTLYYVNKGVKAPLREVASQIAFGNIGGLYFESSTKFMIRLIPFFIYIMIFTTYIYRHFCYSSIYIFARCGHRWKWFLSESLKLYMFSIGYVVIFVIGNLTPGLLAGVIKYDRLGMIFLVHFVMVISLWLFQITLLGNILSMKWGSQIGATAVCIMQAVSVTSLAFIDEMNLTGIEVIKFKLNFASHLMLGWHSIKGYDSVFLNQLDVSINYTETYIYVMLVVIICMIAGAAFVEKVDIIQQNKEV